MAVTYTKLNDGSWGIRTEGEFLVPGATVVVTKKSGEQKRETVGRVLWTDGNVTIASIVAQTRTGTVPAPKKTRRTGAGCPECGKRRRLILDHEDGGMKCYECCDIPSE